MSSLAERILAVLSVAELADERIEEKILELVDPAADNTVRAL